MKKSAFRDIVETDDAEIVRNGEFEFMAGAHNAERAEVGVAEEGGAVEGSAAPELHHFFVGAGAGLLAGAGVAVDDQRSDSVDHQVFGKSVPA